MDARAMYGWSAYPAATDPCADLINRLQQVSVPEQAGICQWIIDFISMRCDIWGPLDPVRIAVTGSGDCRAPTPKPADPCGWLGQAMDKLPPEVSGPTCARLVHYVCVEDCAVLADRPDLRLIFCGALECTGPPSQTGVILLFVGLAALGGLGIVLAGRR